MLRALARRQLGFPTCDPQLGDEENAKEASKFTEEQIVFVLKQAAVGVPVAEVCRKAGCGVLQLA